MGCTERLERERAVQGALPREHGRRPPRRRETVLTYMPIQ